jgi:energy-coupling factor transporter ATP-binding protein EcfA2
MAAPVIAQLADASGPMIELQGQQMVRRDARAARHQPDRRQGREGRGLRPVGLRQVHHDPLHQPAGEHQEGRIIVDGTELTDDTRALDTIRREVGMVFQSSTCSRI